MKQKGIKRQILDEHVDIFLLNETRLQNFFNFSNDDKAEADIK
jgi:hypothetical protein